MYNRGNIQGTYCPLDGLNYSCSLLLTTSRSLNSSVMLQIPASPTIAKITLLTVDNWPPNRAPTKSKPKIPMLPQLRAPIITKANDNLSIFPLHPYPKLWAWTNFFGAAVLLVNLAPIPGFFDLLQPKQTQGIILLDCFYLVNILALILSFINKLYEIEKNR